MTSRFTPAQLQELELRYGLKPVETLLLRVRDGVVHEASQVWWRSEYGPERAIAREHWDNIAKFPEAYQLSKPYFKAVYRDTE